MTLVHRVTPYPHWEFSNDAGDLLRVVPERGGLITGWRCSGRELVYLDLERFLDPAQSVRGGIPVLFPICGGLPNNNLPLPQGTFNIPPHGFARAQAWQLSALADDQGIALELVDNDASRASYPFAFLLRLDIRLENAALAITTTVRNNSSTVMPFSFGLHPYFNISDLKTVRFEGLPGRHLPGTAAEPAVRSCSDLDRTSPPHGVPGALDRSAPGPNQWRSQTRAERGRELSASNPLPTDVIDLSTSA
jgi:D-hexose-6-phosphate mutarotase